MQQTVCLSQCDVHTFSLKPQNTRCWLKGDTNINYCPAFNDDYRVRMNIVPIFNNDQEPSLPGFILKFDESQYQMNHEKYKDDHRRKIMEYTTKKTELLEPRPNKRHRYCGVCKTNYEEYRDHLLGKEHKDCFNRNRYVFLIDKLIKQNNTTGIDESNQTTIQIPDTLSYLKKDKPVQKKRGRPPLTDEQKLINKKERDQRKDQGLEPKIKKKVKQDTGLNKFQEVGIFQNLVNIPQFIITKAVKFSQLDNEKVFSFVQNRELISK